jgi:hypothetical protein
MLSEFVIAKIVGLGEFNPRDVAKYFNVNTQEI